MHHLQTVGMKPLSERDENYSYCWYAKELITHVGMKPLSERDEKVF